MGEKMSTPRSSSPIATGASIFAAMLMMLGGVFQLVHGLVAIINGTTFYASTPNYFLTFNTTTWGWIHLVLGILVGAAGFFILTGNVLARTIGIVLAALQAVVNFIWLPYYPVWGIIVIALDVLVIWALASMRLDEAKWG
ncbi:MAG: hypothetical protein WCG47_21850 [Dermatophilaceae bacterium]